MPRPAANAILTPDQLADIGRALYGNAWQTDLAAGLNIALRSVQRFAAGDHPIHAGIARDLLRLVDQRSDDLKDVRRTLKAATKNA